MKWMIALVLIAFTSPAAAQSRWLETTDESRARHSSENWQIYEQRRSRGIDYPPLGGYPERLGDPAPPGTEQPGYSQRSPFGAFDGRDAYGNRRPAYR